LTPLSWCKCFFPCKGVSTKSHLSQTFFSCDSDQATGRSRGFGFVTFENGGDGAERSVEAQPLIISGKRVEVKLATPREAQAKKRLSSPAPKHLGLRAGQINASSGEFAGLAVAFGRSGWKAGYGSKAFGAAGWNVQGWDQGGPPPDRTGFSFSMLRLNKATSNEPPLKRARR
jgi:RNA recognition motif-containing protein